MSNVTPQIDRQPDLPRSGMNRLWLLGLLFPAVLVVWVLYWVLVINTSVGTSDGWAVRGQYGDMFGALNTLFAGLAFVGIIIAVLLQRHDIRLQYEQLKLQLEELKSTREELALTREELTLIRAESARSASAQEALSSTSQRTAEINERSSQLQAAQTQAGERATTAAVYQSIVTFGNELNDMFVERPDLYDKIFGDDSLPSATAFDDLQRLDPQRFFAAQKWLDYFETILVSWSSIPENLHGHWREYMKSYLRDSTLLQRIVLESLWYGDDLKSICDEARNTNR